MPLVVTDKVDAKYQRVVRSKTHSDWRNWLLKEDVDVIRPKLVEYLTEMGYEDEWDLPEDPKVPSENASKYIMRLAEERGQFHTIEYAADSFSPKQNPLVDPSLEKRPYLIEGIAPRRYKEYPEYGAKIVDPHVETPEGQRVNVLFEGQPYVYMYRVEVTKPLQGVSCWVEIRTVVEDIRVASKGTSQNGGNLETVPAWTTLCPKFDFVCNMGTGVYFLNAAVTTNVDGACNFYAHQITDAAVMVVRASGEFSDTLTAQPLKIGMA
jgi:hypothetical protein